MNISKRFIGALLTCPLMFAFAFYIGPVQAQQGADETEEIVVTGSRIRRDEYCSAAPIQTFDIDAARKNRYVFGTGEEDQALNRTKSVDRRYRKAGIENSKLMVINNMTHRNPDRHEFEKAVLYLDSR